ncbi:hypothetical protein V2G26_007528 [Clonostachys chloroleuca]
MTSTETTGAEPARNDAPSQGQAELSTAKKVELIAAMTSIQLVQMIPFGAGIAATLPIADDLKLHRDVAIWIAASYPLTQGAFVLAGGRIGSMFGHKRTLICAGAWWVLWHLVSGFMRNITGLSFCRGLAGAGGAFMVPNSVALLAINIPPGKMCNIAMGFFGAMAPIGAARGSVIGALFAQLTHWKWLFFFLAMLGAVVFSLISSGIKLHQRAGMSLTTLVPLTVLGAVAAILSAWLIPRLSAQYILAIGALCVTVSITLVATMPAQQSY